MNKVARKMLVQLLIGTSVLIYPLLLILIAGSLLGWFPLISLLMNCVFLPLCISGNLDWMPGIMNVTLLFDGNFCISVAFLELCSAI